MFPYPALWFNSGYIFRSFSRISTTSYLAVTCSVFAFRVQDSGLLGDDLRKRSSIQRLLVQHWIHVYVSLRWLCTHAPTRHADTLNHAPTQTPTLTHPLTHTQTYFLCVIFFVNSVFFCMAQKLKKVSPGEFFFLIFFLFFSFFFLVFGF